MCPYEHAEPNGNLVIQSAKLLSITIVFIAGTLNLKKLGIFVITDEKGEQKNGTKCVREKEMREVGKLKWRKQIYSLYSAQFLS